MCFICHFGTKPFLKNPFIGLEVLFLKASLLLDFLHRLRSFPFSLIDRWRFRRHEK